MDDDSQHADRGRPEPRRLEANPRQESVDEDRRALLLAQVGAFAAYTAPALSIMLTGKAYAQADSIIAR
jgi:hypothetical protein